ncbi:MAG: hypothetical protein ACR2OU_04670 [Thermomicrobiales bacterium]
MALATATTTNITIPAPDIRQASFHLVGTSPLICHAWSEKAKTMMLNKQMKKASPGKEAKNPEQDYLDSLYPLPDGGYGFPSIGFKASMVRAGTYLDQKMTFLRGTFHVNGMRTPEGDDLIPIIGEPRMREDMVKIQMTTDIRYRGEFWPWEAELPIRFNSRSISEEQLASLLVQAGFGTGIGEWRPEKNGSFGMWELA